MALEILLAGAGCVVKKTPDYYLISSVDPTSPSFLEVSDSRRVHLNHVKQMPPSSFSRQLSGIMFRRTRNRT